MIGGYRDPHGITVSSSCGEAFLITGYGRFQVAQDSTRGGGQQTLQDVKFPESARPLRTFHFRSHAPHY